MNFLQLAVQFLLALLVAGLLGVLLMLLTAPIAGSPRLRALRRRLLGRAWRPVLLIPVEPGSPLLSPVQEKSPSDA